MHKFVRSLITEWRKLDLPFTGETIVLAVSGGADSISLLTAIHDLVKRKKFGHRFVVGHFNHKLRGNASDDDELFVRRHAESLGFECFTADSGPIRKGNVEEKARNARYKFLERVARAEKAFAVLTAHTQNDQAETLLLNLIRGSGPDGLAGMRPVRPFTGKTVLVRPLLSWATRAGTEAFCRDHDIEYRSDPMNEDERFTRVRVRRQIIPLLSDLNPRIVETLARTAGLLREMQEDGGQATDPKAANGRDQIRLKDLEQLTKAGIYAELRSWLRSNRGSLRSLELKHIESIERLIRSRKSGKTVELPGGGRVVKHGGRLRFTNIKVEK